MEKFGAIMTIVAGISFIAMVGALATANGQRNSRRFYSMAGLRQMAEEANPAPYFKFAMLSGFLWLSSCGIGTAVNGQVEAEQQAVLAEKKAAEDARLEEVARAHAEYDALPNTEKYNRCMAAGRTRNGQSASIADCERESGYYPVGGASAALDDFYNTMGDENPFK